VYIDGRDIGYLGIVILREDVLPAPLSLKRFYRYRGAQLPN
jgi:hypothetical protein